jgi:hypothetical protein
MLGGLDPVTKYRIVDKTYHWDAAKRQYISPQGEVYQIDQSIVAKNREARIRDAQLQAQQDKINAEADAARAKSLKDSVGAPVPEAARPVPVIKDMGEARVVPSAPALAPTASHPQPVPVPRAGGVGDAPPVSEPRTGKGVVTDPVRPPAEVAKPAAPKVDVDPFANQAALDAAAKDIREAQAAKPTTELRAPATVEAGAPKSAPFVAPPVSIVTPPTAEALAAAAKAQKDKKDDKEKSAVPGHEQGASGAPQVTEPVHAQL